MAEIIPFGAVHYNAKKIMNLSEVTCPPYDVISPEKRSELLERSPYNYVNLTLPEGEGDDKYREAMNKIFSWLLRDVLVTDDHPYYYLYEQDFKFQGQTLKRVGLVGLLKVEDYGNNVLRHERTFPKYVQDRKKLLTETKCELEGIMLLYSDEGLILQTALESYVNSHDPILVSTDDNQNTHSIYRVEDDALTTKIREFSDSSKVYIADGHHRYETALQYMKESKEALGEKYKGNEPFHYQLCTFFNAYDKAIKIFPTHRLVKTPAVSGVALLKALENNYKFGAVKFNGEREERAARLKIRKVLDSYAAKGLHAFGLSVKEIPNQYFILTLKNDPETVVSGEFSADLKGLDVLILESSILSPILNIDTHSKSEEVKYVRGDDAALDDVKSGEFGAAFLMNAVTPVQVVKVSDNSEEMPHKSTDFYPKLLSGLFAYSMKYSTLK